MYNIDLANVKSIVADIVAKHNVENVAFVGCGASKAELYPAKYFLANCSKKLRVAHYTANEFNYDTPDWLGDTTVVITALRQTTLPSWRRWATFWHWLWRSCSRWKASTSTTR